MIRILKFGGTSVGSPEALKRACAIIHQELPGGGLVVVSALSGTTDKLLQAMAASAKGDLETSGAAFAALETRHWTVAETLGLSTTLRPVWEPLFKSLAGQLQGMGLLWEASPRSRDAVLSIGETLSASLLAALLQSQGRRAAFREVREVMGTDARHGRARPDLARLKAAVGPWREHLSQGALWVTQGFLGSAPDGSTTTLGRGGSDTSATLLGEALEAEEVQIWTDVDGVLSADPSLVALARPIPVMSLREAAALSAYGAKVLHADALAPVGRCGFRLIVANTHRPQGGRTEIRSEAPPRAPGEITSVAYKEGVTCLRLPPAREPEQLFQAATRLLEAGASLYGLLATPDGGLLVARGETAESEGVLQDLAASGLSLQRGWAVVALVGEGLREAPGLAPSLLGPLNGEAIAAILAGDTGVSLAFLVPQDRLPVLIPKLHAHCIETTPIMNEEVSHDLRS